MKCTNFIFKLAICFLTVATTLAIVTMRDVVNAQIGNIETEDNCMKIAVDSIQKMDRLPDVFNSSASPKGGHVFWVAELSIKEIKCGYIFFKALTDRIISYDNNFKIYPLFDWRVQKVQFEDPHDIASNTAFVEGSKLIIAFEILLQSDLASIKYTYDYGSSWADYDVSSRATIIIGESNLPPVKPMPWIPLLLLDKTEPGWVTIMSETFEGSFPTGAWSFLGNPTWAVDEYKPHDGAKSAWCAKGGTFGIEPETKNYANQMAAWMIYGPFDLSDASDAELVFYLWLNSESEHDYFQWLASTDGTNFHGWQTTGNKNGWIKEVLDLKSVYTIGNLCGKSKVWIAVYFGSDSSGTSEGAFVDDILLRKKVKQFWLQSSGT